MKTNNNVERIKGLLDKLINLKSWVDIQLSTDCRMSRQHSRISVDYNLFGERHLELSTYSVVEVYPLQY